MKLGYILRADVIISFVEIQDMSGSDRIESNTFLGFSEQIHLQTRTRCCILFLNPINLICIFLPRYLDIWPSYTFSRLSAQSDTENCTNICRLSLLSNKTRHRISGSAGKEKYLKWKSELQLPQLIAEWSVTYRDVCRIAESRIYWAFYSLIRNTRLTNKTIAIARNPDIIAL